MIILLKIWKSLFLFWNEDYRHGKKAWTRGQCPRKLLRIVEIFGTWKIIYSYFVEKPYILRKILNIWQNYRLWTMISTIFLNFWQNFDMSIFGNLNFFFFFFLTKRVCGIIDTFSMSGRLKHLKRRILLQQVLPKEKSPFDSYCSKY